MAVYTWLFVVGMIVAFIDAFGIGANDNANNFANAIAAGVLTPAKAVVVAAIFEFLGAVLVGNNVAEAIRGRVINTNLYRGNPALLQLAMVCALVGSSTWIMLATRYGVPVSTTHSIIGAVLGVGIAAFGPGVVVWDYGSGAQLGRGFGGIVASWFISIVVSGAMASIAYLIMKYGVLRYRNSFQRSLVFAPAMFGITYGLMALALVWKGTPKLGLEGIPDSTVVAIVLGVWAASTLATYAWICYPMYLFHWVGKELTWYDYILGPFIPEGSRPLRQGFSAAHLANTSLSAVHDINTAAAASATSTSIFKMFDTSVFASELDKGFEENEKEIREFNERAAAAEAAAKASTASTDSESAGASPKATDVILKGVKTVEGANGEEPTTISESNPMHVNTLALTDPREAHIRSLEAKLAGYEDKANSPRKVWFREWQARFKAAPWYMKVYLAVRFVVMFGIDGREIQNYHASEADRAHIAFAPKWQSKTEDMYITLNVITSCIQAFAHGSNDVANAIGPLATIWHIYNTNTLPNSRTPVEIWHLAYGGAGIVLGLALYGYNIMRVLGNNLTYQSPSRGFCMDLGSAITILIASKEGFPISTTQCITGATVGVGLANGEWRAVNWRLFGKIFASWIITLPAAGTVAGLIFSFAAYSPNIAHNPTAI